MRDTKFECMGHGWRSETQVCPFCLITVYQEDLKAIRQKTLKEVWKFVREDCNPNYTIFPTTIAQKMREKFAIEI